MLLARLCNGLSGAPSPFFLSCFRYYTLARCVHYWEIKSPHVPLTSVCKLHLYLEP